MLARIQPTEPLHDGGDDEQDARRTLAVAALVIGCSYAEAATFAGLDVATVMKAWTNRMTGSRADGR